MALEQFFYDNANPCWVYECKSRHFIEVNRKCVSVYGYTEDDFLQELTIDDLQPKEDADLLKEYLKEDPEFGNNGIWRHKTRSGVSFHVRIFTQATKLNGQKCMYVMATNVEQEIQQARKFRESYCDFERLQTIILSKTKDKTLTSVKKEAEQKGYPLREFNTITLKHPLHI
jgi:PAS domain S-box-containing protein